MNDKKRLSSYDDLPLVLEGTEAKILSDVVAQFYAYLSGSMFNDPVGMAIYAELHYMMSSLMLGEWFE